MKTMEIVLTMKTMGRLTNPIAPKRMCETSDALSTSLHINISKTNSAWLPTWCQHLWPSR